VTPPSQAASAKTPVIMLHGGFHNGSCYFATPDARPGWAPLFADAGRNIFVPDWPGHGRSPMAADFVTLSTVDVMQSLIALLEQIGPAVLLVHSATVELKTDFTQRVEDAVDQYRFDRWPRPKGGTADRY
jgi:pimeloyl-ACP methyl ester carboxylesterase